MSDKFSNFKKSCIARIKKNIAHSLNKKCFNPGLYTPMKYVMLPGGKFLRGLLVYAVGKTLKVNLPLLDQPATAIELIHTYTLIHDDLPSMDNDNLRRGKPSCHIKFDEATAILTGDALQSLAFEVISERKYKKINTSTYVKWTNYLAKCLGPKGLAAGQYMDLSINKKNVHISTLNKIYNMKTVMLIDACVMLPIMLAKNLSKNQKKIFMDFSRIFGMSFQIKDDLLGYTTSTSILGKTKMNDNEREQPNYIELYGVDKTSKILKENKNHIINILDELPYDTYYLGHMVNTIFSRKY